MSNNCSISQIERSSEVNIAENAFSMFGSHAPQNEDHDLFSLSYCDYEYQWISADQSIHKHSSN